MYAQHEGLLLIVVCEHIVSAYEEDIVEKCSITR